MCEIWMNIKNYEGIYQVSNKGNVKSLPKKLPHTSGGFRMTKERILKYTLDKDGYCMVCLTNNYAKKYIRIHRLVAEAFLPNPNGYTEINHKDEDKTNNCVENLEWCDRKYNCNYGTRNQRLHK